MLAFFAGCASTGQVGSKRGYKLKPMSPTDPQNYRNSVSGEVDAIPSPVTGKIKVSKPYTVRGVTYYPLATSRGYTETGIASWYGPNFHGKRSANGEIYNQNDRTAAHLILPFNVMVKVENLDNGKTTIVRINDRGPFAKGRIIDLSNKAAHEIGMVKKGTAHVRLTAISHKGQVSTEYERPEPIYDEGLFYVIAGSFTQPLKAKNVASQVPSSLQDITSVKPTKTKLGTMHRVVVGPFSTRAKAGRASKQIQIYARTSTFVTTTP